MLDMYSQCKGTLVTHAPILVAFYSSRTICLTGIKDPEFVWRLRHSQTICLRQLLWAIPTIMKLDSIRANRLAWGQFVDREKEARGKWRNGGGNQGVCWGQEVMNLMTATSTRSCHSLCNPTDPLAIFGLAPVKLKSIDDQPVCQEVF